ncbi:MAG: deoxyribonuclease V, partial [Planctomycetes bacterium]|nr:deoxyribonuclease V [Planctomycetota bacterium]
QNTLRRRLVLAAPADRIGLVAGADVGFAAGGKTAIGGVVLFSWPSLEVVDVALAARPTRFPYIPGLLSFREIPVLAAAFGRLCGRPDVVFCDGQGLAHPRRLGLACHLGVVLGVATIGCAKSVLVGKFDEPGALRGALSVMRDSGEVVGAAVRTRDNVRPIYVSPGHMMDLDTAVDLVLAAGRGYRLPEPTRCAHNLVARAKASHPSASAAT